MSPSIECALAALHPAVRAWFIWNFAAPSPPQLLGWPLIAAGKNILLLAPTGSGKTMAAFLQCLGRFYTTSEAGLPEAEGVRLLYVSPLKALNNDIYRNLLLPLEGIAREAKRMGLEPLPLRIAVRTGDTPPAVRRAMLREPPSILITTPESLSLLLSSRARDILRTVETVIVDELHALYPNKRGVHLALSLEHLESLTGRPLQRIGLSATVNPASEAAAFLAGGVLAEDDLWRPRPVEIVDTGRRKELDLQVVVPVEDLKELPEKTIWPAIVDELLVLVRAHRSTLVFVNNRRLAERLTAALNERAGAPIARAHHGSLARETRLEAEELLKQGRLPCLVATSSLELGIDVGAIDLVVQVESPKEVARGLQRVGRAGHLLELPSKGRIIPKNRADLLDCALIAHEMRAGRMEAAYVPQNCLDVLAQQMVALTVTEERGEEELYRIVRRAYPYRELGREHFARTLGMLAGDDDDGRFLGLRPLVFWDRINRRVRATDRGRRLLYRNGGTIPDRGYFPVYHAESGVRLGELDEEFVFERRRGDRFLLGTGLWRIEEIRHNRVLVRSAGRGEALVPFWRGETVGRSYELGRRMGEFLEELAARLEDDDFQAWLARECLLDQNAAANLREYLLAQRRATGFLPSHRRLVVEEYRDELGEWRVMVHAPFGMRVNLGLALLMVEDFREKEGLELEFVHDDDGILFHAPGGAEPPSFNFASLPQEDLPTSLGRILRGLPIFATAFRENAARALLLPAGGRERTPLWLARLRAADLLQTVSDRPDFPLILETMRDCLMRFLDLEGLRGVLAGLADGTIFVHRCRTRRPSPFAGALAFRLIGEYMYTPDLPKGERRFLAFGLDQAGLNELLGGEGLRDLLDVEAVAAVAAEARGEAAHLRPQSADELHAWLCAGRELVAEAVDEKQAIWLEELKAAGRVALLAWPRGEGVFRAWVAAEDAPLYLVAIPRIRQLWPEVALPPPLLEGREARRRLVRRFAATHGPFTLEELAGRYGLPPEEVAAGLAELVAEGILVAGEFTPARGGIEWCHRDLLRKIRRLSLAKARKEIAPRRPADYALFLARWHGILGSRKPQTIAEALTGLAGFFLPALAWDELLALRSPDYRPAELERLVATGRFSWRARGQREGMEIGFLPFGTSWPTWETSSSLSPAAIRIVELLRTHGASFLAQLMRWSDLDPGPLLAALEELMAAGLVTNDNLGPVRYFAGLAGKKGSYRLSQRILEGMGRWALVDEGPPPGPEEMAERLLARYGLVTGEHARREGTAWEELLQVYDRWETMGRLRRSYFVRGLAGIQYALPEAVEELRTPRREGEPAYWALFKCDPANPYGSLFPLPVPGVQVEAIVLREGEPVLAAGGRKMRIVPLAELKEDELRAALLALMKLFARRGRLRVAEFAGRPVLTTPAAEILTEMGFERVYREMVKWA
ncbi:MAG: DEAD/DEAH box helicase [Firmicutes bacterium]|nr:DEAD/DEAH box helicase [Bacillota bacterium]